MDQCLVAYHKKHFHQVYSTPFTVHPLHTLITKKGPLGFLKALEDKSIKIEKLKVSEATKEIIHWLTPSQLDPPILD